MKENVVMLLLVAHDANQIIANTKEMHASIRHNDDRGPSMDRIIFLSLSFSLCTYTGT